LTMMSPSCVQNRDALRRTTRLSQTSAARPSRLGKGSHIPNSQSSSFPTTMQNNEDLNATLRIVVVMARRLSSSPAVLATPSTIGCNGLYSLFGLPACAFHQRRHTRTMQHENEEHITRSKCFFLPRSAARAVPRLW